MKLWSERGGKAFSLAGVALLFAVAIAFWPVSNSHGTGCGNWLSASYQEAKIKDSYANAGNAASDYGRVSSGGSALNEESDEVSSCDSARADQAIPMGLFVFAAVVLAVVGFVQRGRPQSQVTPTRSGEQ